MTVGDIVSATPISEEGPLNVGPEGAKKIEGRSPWRLAFERLRSELQVVDAALGALGTMTRARLTSPEVATSIREEYEHRARAAESAIEQLQLEHHDLRHEENERTRRHLLFVEKEHLLEARRSGIIGEEAYMTLVANADARLLDLEAEPAEENKPADDQPSDARA